MEIGETLAPVTRVEWRAWLQEHHATASEIWRISYTKASGKPFLSYDEAVEEALCFGWIDSTNKPHGPDSRAQRFTPRRKGSPWSELNKIRARKMVRLGLMTPAGLAAGIDFLDQTYVIPADIQAIIDADPEVAAHVATFSEDYLAIRIGWIDAGRGRPEFEQRLRHFLKMTRQGKQFGTIV